MIKISPTLSLIYDIINVGNKVRDKTMNKYLEIIKNLISHQTEEEWFEFKENWYEAHGIGEYTSKIGRASCRERV